MIIGLYPPYSLGHTRWIDVSPTAANLLASGGEDADVKIFDRRGSKIVKTFKGIHSGKACLINYSCDS